MTTTAAAPSSLAPEVLRLLSTADAPFAGELVAGDPPCVWVAADEFGSTPAWTADGDGHVLAPLDVAHTASGPAIVLPHCLARLRDAVSRAARISPGEAVTIAVSILRGAVEATRLDAPHGQWWLTADGRPVLALTGGDPWSDEAGAVLALLAGARGPELTRAIGLCLDALTDPATLARRAPSCEDALFDAAPPAPLELRAGTETRPVRAREAASAAASAARTADMTTRRVLPDVTAQLIGAELADRIVESVRAVARRVVPSRRAPAPHAARTDEPDPGRARDDAGGSRRRTPWLVAAGLAVVLTAAGVWWPQSEAATVPRGGTPASPGATAPALDPSTSALAPPTTPPSAAAPAEGTVDDLAEIGRDALVRLAQCVAAADGACSAWEDPLRPLPAHVLAPGPDADVSVVDEYGGVAALRVDAADATSQIVVIVQAGKTWLVRDVYDVADQ